MGDPIDITLGVASAVASIAVIVYIWWRNSWARLVNEFVIEAALLVLLALALTSFLDETALFRRRIKVSVGLMYAASLFSVAAFGFSSALSAWRGRTDASVRNISYRLSQVAWFLFIFTMLAAFVAYLTVSEETKAVNNGDGESVITGLVIAPAMIAFGIVLSHCICACAACCCRKEKSWYKWRDTSAYHEKTHKILLTIAAGIFLIGPAALAASGGSFEEFDADDEVGSLSSQDLVTFFVDILAAGLHRLSLAEYDKDIGRGRAQALKREDESLRNAALSNPSLRSLPSPATSGAVPASVATAATVPPATVPPGSAPPQPRRAASQAVPQPASPPPAAGAGANHGGWKASRAADGRVYYHNSATGETSWNWPPPSRAAPLPAVPVASLASQHPMPSAAPAAPQAAALVEQLAPGWAVARAADGRPYYYHAQSGSSSWVVPG